MRLEDVARPYLVAVFLTLAAFSCADDAAWMQVGDVSNFTKNKQIRMVQEHVWISLSNKRMRVHALFQFQNEGPATKVTMAFPDGILDYKPRKPSAPQAIRWMTSKVDGKSVSIKRQPYLKVKGFDYDSYTHVWLKSVDFKKGQTRFVTVDYEAAHGDIGDYIQDIYTLKTGATWKGTIGKAVIYIDWSAMNGRMDPRINSVPSPNYGGPSVKMQMLGPRSAKVVYRNIEPDFDIGMTWSPAFWNFFVDGRRVSGLPVSDGRSTFISGGGADPQICAEQIYSLFLTRAQEDEARHDDSEMTAFSYRGKRFNFQKRRLYINGKALRLRRGYRIAEEYETWVYVKDLVKALGGSYRYDSRLDRAYIRF